MTRKTIEVGKLVYRLNYFLKHDGDGCTDQQEITIAADQRDIMIAFVEGVLQETGNYRGFEYLPTEDYPNEIDGLGTRRRYFVSSTISDDYETAQGVAQ